MLKRIVVGGTILAVILGAWLFDSMRGGAALACSLLAVLVSVGAMEELMSMGNAKPARKLVGRIAVALWLGLLALAALVDGAIPSVIGDVLVAASLATVAFITLHVRSGPGPVPFRLAGSLWFQVPYVGGVACLLLLLMAGLLDFTQALVITAKASDIGAYFTGKAIGKHKLAPAVSPNKTVQGAIGGIALSALVGWWLLGGRVIDVPSGTTIPTGAPAALLGAVVAVLAMLGDLSESLLKRARQVKDSGTLFGPSGGFLDLVDSLLLVGPFAVAYTAVAV